MRKLIAIVNVIAWSGFWAFGYLALTSGDFSDTQVVISALLAAAGLYYRDPSLSATGPHGRAQRIREEDKSTGRSGPQPRAGKREHLEHVLP
jgi:hypothetical protein